MQQDKETLESSAVSFKAGEYTLTTRSPHEALEASGFDWAAFGRGLFSRRFLSVIKDQSPAALASLVSGAVAFVYTPETPPSSGEKIETFRREGTRYTLDLLQRVADLESVDQLRIGQQKVRESYCLQETPIEELRLQLQAPLSIKNLETLIRILKDLNYDVFIQLNVLDRAHSDSQRRYRERLQQWQQQQRHIGPDPDHDLEGYERSRRVKEEPIDPDTRMNAETALARESSTYRCKELREKMEELLTILQSLEDLSVFEGDEDGANFLEFFKALQSHLRQAFEGGGDRNLIERLLGCIELEKDDESIPVDSRHLTRAVLEDDWDRGEYFQKLLRIRDQWEALERLVNDL